MQYHIIPMNPEYAAEISVWQYPAPYSIYSMDGSQELLNELQDGSYWVAQDNSDEVIDYFCFGENARVPTQDTIVVYQFEDALDVGLGMRPDICGRGLGLDFILCGLDYATKAYSHRVLRLTVAAFNERAITVYQQVGFEYVSSFVRSGAAPMKFHVMTLTYPF